MWYKYFLVPAAISGCGSLLESSSDTLFELAVVENLGLQLKFWRYLSYYKYYRLGGHVAISDCQSVFEIIVFEIAVVDSLRFAVEKKQI